MMLDIFEVLKDAMTEAYRAGYEAGFHQGYYSDDRGAEIDEAQYDRDYDEYMEDANEKG